MKQLNIKYVSASELKIPDWKATHILRPDLLVLSASLMEFGFIEPIHIRASTKEVIDGSERLLLALNVSRIIDAHGDMIPVIEHDCDGLTAMMMHLRLNRGRGSLVAKKTSNIIRKLKQSGKYNRHDFESLLCMKTDELEVMLEASIIKIRKISEHTYSRAWVPIEAPAGTVDNGQVVERPPNQDR